MPPTAPWGKRIALVAVGFLLGVTIDSPLTAVLGALIGWLLARDREHAALAQWLVELLGDQQPTSAANRTAEPVSGWAAPTAMPGAAAPASTAPDAATASAATASAATASAATASAATASAATASATAPNAVAVDTTTAHPDATTAPTTVAETVLETPTAAVPVTPAGATTPPPVWSAPLDVPPMPPREPAAIERVFAAVRGYFTTGNVVAKVGVLVLFLGIAFLVNYALDHALLPPQLRLAGAALLGAGLLVLGYRLRDRADAYGLLLQGAGIGVLYLTVFAALQFFALLPPIAALVLLLALVFAGAVLAVRQNSELLAAFASSGGFAAPLLVSSGSGNVVALFGFYLLLDLGILAMAWYRAWRIVNVLAFLFTFGIGTLWGAQSYRPENYLVSQLFLAAFFLHFVVVALLFARSAQRLGAALEEHERKSQSDSPFRGALAPAAVNGTLVFGVPIVVFGLQSQLVDDRPYGIALSALAMAFVYLAAAGVVRRWHAVPALLGDAFVALALIFGSLAIPLAVTDQRLTGAAWAIEGAGLIWLGFRQQRRYMRVFGLLLQHACGGALLVASLSLAGAGDWAGYGLSCALAAVAIWFGSWRYARRSAVADTPDDASIDASLTARPPQGWLALWLMIWGGVWWAVALAYWLDALVVPQYVQPVAVVGSALSLLLLTWTGARAQWFAARAAGLLGLPLYSLALLGAWADGGFPARLDLTLAWLFATVVLWAVLRLRSAAADAAINGVWHLATLPTAVVAAASFAASWAARSIQPGDGWVLAAPSLVGIAALAALVHAPWQQRWPIVAFPTQYSRDGVLVLVGLAVLWIALIGWQPALAEPLPTLPLLNPHELAQLALLLMVIQQLRVLAPQALGWLVGGAAFLLLTQSALRASHVLGGVAYEAAAFAESAVTQAVLSLVWALAAVVTMFFAARRSVRVAWLAGAGLLGVVVLKLLLVDQAGVGAIARIVSFIGVGGLMLLIGYLAPLPPAREPAAESAS